MSKKVVVLHQGDNVATAVSDLEPNDLVEVRGEKMKVAEKVPFGHKIALTPIARGATVTKYGESIGVAMRDIGAGQCVHIQNVESQRGRGDLAEGR